MGVVMIFIDGVGLGAEDMQNNPFAFTPTPRISSMLGGKKLTKEAVGYEGQQVSLLALDATLGVPGIPQSATGQASLFTGVNAPQLVGKHVNRYPHQPLKELLQEKGVFTLLVQSKLEPAFFNAYRPEFFIDLANGLTRPYSCSTFLTYYAGTPFRTLDDLSQGKAVYMDITNAFLEKMGYEVSLIKPEEAALRIATESRYYHFLLFEYFLSDLVAHRRDEQQAGEIVATLDRFLGELVDNLHADTQLIVTSDHGNMEDMSHGEHTLNPVPALVAGSTRWRRLLAEEVTDISGIVPAVWSYLQTTNNSIVRGSGEK